nr:hypothetical protein [uncultured Flavobacterium sp.]
MKCIFAIILFLLCNFQLSAQNDTIKVERLNEKSLSIDIEKGEILSSSKIKLDSVNVDFIKYKDKVETNSTFKNRKTSVSVEFYFENKKLILAYVKQFDPYSKEYWIGNRFYFEDGKIFSDDELFFRNPSMDDKSSSKAYNELYDYYGHNFKLDSDFLKEYILKLMEKI